MNRRRFLKYAAATGAVLGASALALDYVLSPRLGPANQSTVTLNPMRSTSKQNHPPVAGFDYKPKYLNPTDQQTIQFTNTSHDPDNDPLTYSWYVDGKPISTQKDYSSKLSTGEHVVQLNVSDGISQDSVQQGITVEPDQIYPSKPLHLKYKGARYSAGALTPDFPNITTPGGEEMEEHLDAIRNDLGCNAICIDAGAGYEDNLIECGRLAIEKGFDRICIQPRYINATVEDTIESVGKLAERVRELREISEAVVYYLGHEFTLETSGIVPGDDWFERVDYVVKNSDWPKKVEAKFPHMFRDLATVCKQNYGYKVSYAAIAWCEADVVPWSDPSFESIGVDAYLQPVSGATEDWVVRLLSRLKKYGKPVNSTEAGCMTFSGAAELGGLITWNAESFESFFKTHPYDEDEQANYIERYCNLLNSARVDGYYYTQYNDTWDRGYGLYNGAKRKKGFYMYKSYQRVP